MEEEALNIQYSPLEQQLIEAIQESLQNSIPSNAVFLAERLFAERDNENTRNILAECYLAENKPYKAYYILQKCFSEQNRYKFAQACMKLNKLKQAEKALLGNSYPYNQNLNNQQQQQKVPNVPNGGYGYYLLGVICERLYNQKDAQEYFVKALELNPNMWVAYEKLCKMGERILPSKIFNEINYNQYKEKQESKNGQSQEVNSLKYQKFQNNSDFKRNSDLFDNQQGRNNNGQKIQLQNQSILQGQGTCNMGQAISNQQLNFNQHNYDQQQQNEMRSSQIQSSQQQQRGQHRKNLSMGGNSFTSNLQSGFNNMTGSQIIQEPNQQQQQQQPQSIQSLYPQARGNNQYSNKKYNNNNQQQQQQQNQQGSGINDIWLLLQKFALPFQSLSSYQCQEAIKYFDQLPKNHYNTGWVLTNIGRCYMEIVKYQEAEKFYSESFKLEPYRLEGLEYYSACLWQLKKQVDLCWLANNALEKNLFAPETWIAVGNCFSLNKENENALKFFNRAIQLNPNNAYAHCLSGHEFVYNEDFQKAKRCFDHALNLDIRHYNAWWGLGNIFYKQEQYDKALENFKKSIEINDKNPVLYSFMAMTLSAKREYIHSLDYFKQSEKLDPSNGLNKYQKATTLFKLERYKEALRELEQLYQLMPREAPIPMLMGQIFKKMGDKSNAMKYFNLALDLETKDQQRIKTFIESLHNSSGGDFQEELEI